MDAIKNFFTVILYQPLFNILIFLAWLIPGHSIGWAIIAMTVIIRLILAPSTNKTYAHQRAMLALQPKMAELKDKHKDDQTAYSKAIMELYAAEKVNPLGGCLPALIQLPIPWALYQVFINGLSTQQYNLLYSFTPRVDSINTMWFGLDLSKPEPWILPIVVGILQFIQIKQSTPPPQPTGNEAGDATAQSMMRMMTFIAPVIAWSVARQFPAALALYYATFSLFAIAQYAWFMRKPMTAAQAIAEAKKEGLITVTVRKKDTGGKDDK